MGNSISDVGSDGLEPYNKKEAVAGGHARVIIGYDDIKVIPGAPIKGAFYVRNSWGTGWGDQGYSWVSYQIFIDQQTDCMGITSENYPGSNPTPPSPTPDDCPTTLSNAKSIIYATSITASSKITKLKSLIPK